MFRVRTKRSAAEPEGAMFRVRTKRSAAEPFSDARRVHGGAGQGDGRAEHAAP
jgi:hypothetical protein